LTKFSLRFQYVACQIPYSAEQGILLGEQGIFCADRGPPQAAAREARGTANGSTKSHSRVGIGILDAKDKMFPCKRPN
jgi:hypothetical protein